MQEYVVGFLFNEIDDVVLIRKNRPEWQNGLLNGVGGKVEQNEKPDAAMVREFAEETGVTFTEWENYAFLESPRSKIWVYRGFTDFDTFASVKTQEDEPVETWYVGHVAPKDGVPNLSWLIPAALLNRGEFLTVTYP